MHIKFDETYLNRSGRSVAMVVANAVQDDSRVIKTASTLSKLGFRIHLFGMSKTDHNETLPGYPFSIELAKNPSYKMKAEGLWLDEQKRRNIPLFINLLAKNVAELIGNRRFDILHTHDMYGLPVGAVLKDLALQPNIVWVHDVHEFVEGCTNIDEHVRTGMWQFEQEHIRQPHALTTVSPILSQILTNKYGASQIGLVMNTPRLADFDPWYPFPIREILNLDKKIPLVVYIGNAKPERGVHLGVEALAFLPDVHLAFITNSKGEYIDLLFQKAKMVNASDRVHLLPYVPNSEVTSFLQNVNVGLNPVSLYANSDLAFPNKIFEYIHSGTPIVSTSTSALSGFLEENRCGATYPEGDVKALANTIHNVIVQFPDGLPNVAQGSSLAKEYCWEKQEEVISAIYDRLFENGKMCIPNKSSRPIEPIIQLPVYGANQPFTFAKALKKKNHLVECASLTTNKFGFGCDFQINKKEHSVKSIESYLAQQELSNYQTYHYHVRSLIYRGDFSFPTGIDLVLLKAMGKSVFFHFRGSEARLSSIFKESTPYHYVDEQINQDYDKMPFLFDENRQVAFRDFVCGVCDDVFVNDPELQCYVPNALIVPRAIDIDNFSTKQQTLKGSIPLVVHAPSRRGVKGTHYVLKAVNVLKKEGYQFDFKLVEHMPHQEAMKIYRDATIIVDQLRIGWYGVLAVEGMSLGKAVVCYIRNDLRHYLPNPPPLAIANPENISEVLRYLLENPATVSQYGKAGKKFVEEYHHSQRVAKLLVDIYSRPFRPIDPVAATTFWERQTENFEIKVTEKYVKKKLSEDFPSNLSYYKKFVYYMRQLAYIIKNQGIKEAAHKSAAKIRRTFSD